MAADQKMTRKTWADAWTRILSAVANAKRRRDPWTSRLETMSTKSARNVWRIKLSQLARRRRQHKDSHKEWNRRLDVMRRSDQMRERRAG